MIRADVLRERRLRRRARGAGEAVIAITVARDGALISHHLRKSSGNRDFDAAVLQAVTDADPYPPAPEGFAAARYDFVLPVRFK